MFSLYQCSQETTELARGVAIFFRAFWSASGVQWRELHGAERIEKLLRVGLMVYEVQDIQKWIREVGTAPTRMRHFRTDLDHDMEIAHVCNWQSPGYPPPCENKGKIPSCRVAGLPLSLICHNSKHRDPGKTIHQKPMHSNTHNNEQIQLDKS